MNFTKPQQAAIDIRDRNILVSAAAGSGKTAVLTERVISMLTGENPVSAERLIIVTFTTAAAIEMKQRIEAKLAALIENDPENELLSSQQLLLSKAKISTIHALCNSLVRENFEQLGLPLSYRVGESNEISALKAEVLEELLEECYEKKEDNFISLANFFSQKDDRKLTEIINSVYEFISPYPFPIAVLEDFLQLYETDKPFLETKWGLSVFDYLVSALEKAISYLDSAKSLAVSDELLSEKYGDPIQNDIDAATLTKAALLEHDWNKACRISADYKKSRLGAVRGYDSKEFLDNIKALREVGTKLYADLFKRYFSINDDAFHEDIALLHDKSAALFSIVEQFSERFSRRKLADGIIDFSDLEHFALKLLLTKTPLGYKKTPLAANISEQYEEIMVDECQDLNLVQNLIFWAMSKSSDEVSFDTDELLNSSKNLFFVGDVKQSIYRFRNAVPSLFVRRKKLFKSYDEHTDTASSTGKTSTKIPIKISLQNNFRSRCEVTSAVNLVFSRLMSEELGDIAYDENESLVASATYCENNDAKAELHFVNAPSSKEKLEPTDEQNDDSKVDIEAQYIANLIEKMVADGYKVAAKTGERPCTYRDFCILLRAKKSKTEHYVKALNTHSIDCYTESTSGYINSFEISVMMDLLRILDNPLLDVPLFSVLLSPMFGLSVDDLAEIRLQNRRSPLYINLQILAKNGNSKCEDFLKLYSFLREQAIILPIDRLIQKIYDRTGFLFVVQAMSSGEQKRANLRLLLSYAQSYEQIGAKGLDGFLRFVDRAVERGEDLNCANTISERANVVRIMSIHGSKGLEFPICIVADCGKGFNMREINKPYILNGNCGFGMKIRKPEELKEYSNLPLEAIRLAEKKESLSEEMRTLYVAMTRAKEKLILVGTLPNISDEVTKILKASALSASNFPFHLLSQSSYLAWLVIALKDETSLTAAFNADNNKAEFSTDTVKYLFSDYSGKSSEPEVLPTFKAVPNDEIIAEIERSINFSYPYKVLSELPAKVTVTKLAKAKNEEKSTALDVLRLSDSDEISAAMRGTILHSFMQYADFSLAISNLNAEINRLNMAHFLSDIEVRALNLKKITAFLHSNLCARMMSAENLFREYQFIYSIPASEVKADIEPRFKDEKVLMQGIADTVFEEPDGIVIVDYKTDRLSEDAAFIEKYGAQLRIYREALNEYFEKPIKESIIYSLHLEREIKVF